MLKKRICSHFFNRKVLIFPHQFVMFHVIFEMSAEHFSARKLRTSWSIFAGWLLCSSFSNLPYNAPKSEGKVLISESLMTAEHFSHTLVDEANNYSRNSTILESGKKEVAFWESSWENCQTPRLSISSTTFVCDECAETGLIQSLFLCLIYFNFTSWVNPLEWLCTLQKYLFIGLIIWHLQFVFGTQGTLQVK